MYVSPGLTTFAYDIVKCPKDPIPNDECRNYHGTGAKAESIQNNKMADDQNPPDNARMGCLNPERAWSGVMSAGALRRHLNLGGGPSS